jgi:hypothetical protein
MVLRYDADAHEAVICAGWGPDTDWVRNLRAGPAVQVRLGRGRFPRSTGSCQMTRPSTSPSSSAGSTRGGYACSARSLAGETSVTTLRSATSSRATRLSRSARRRSARPDQTGGQGPGRLACQIDRARCFGGIACRGPRGGGVGRAPCPGIAGERRAGGTMAGIGRVLVAAVGPVTQTGWMEVGGWAGAPVGRRSRCL